MKYEFQPSNTMRNRQIIFWNWKFKVQLFTGLVTNGEFV